MNILLITTSLQVGGAEKQVCDLADQFIIFGHKVKIISLTGETILKPNNKNIDIVELRLKKNPISLLKSFFKAIVEIRKFEVDVLHSHMVHANLFSRLLKLYFFSTPLICTAHSTNEGGIIRTLLYRYTDFLCDLNTNVSDEAVSIYIEKKISKANKIITMGNGIDTDRFKFDYTARLNKRAELNIGDDNVLILAVGRLCEAKDYPNLIDAFYSLLNINSEKKKLVIIGCGELEQKLKVKVDLLGLNEAVIFLSLQSDIEKWMSAADIFVMSSAWEGLPLALLEAMASERLVVATDCGGIKNTVGENGFIVPPKDSKQLTHAFVNCIQLSLEDKRNIGKNARKSIIQSYSLSAITRKWLSIYNSKLELK